MNNSPWLSEKSLEIVNLILKSYAKSFGEPLLHSSDDFLTNIEKGTTLFTFRNPVIAHNAASDPCLIYANSSALLLWSRQWHEMIGLPSRLTAPEEARQERQKTLEVASRTNSIKDYQGLRINSKGELFKIKNVRIWTVLDEKENIYGQAATFDDWHKL